MAVYEADEIYGQRPGVAVAIEVDPDGAVAIQSPVAQPVGATVDDPEAQPLDKAESCAYLYRPAVSFRDLAHAALTLIHAILTARSEKRYGDGRGGPVPTRVPVAEPCARLRPDARKELGVLTPEQEAAYSLDYGVSRADLKPEVQAAYDRLLAERRAKVSGASTFPESIRAEVSKLRRRLPASVRYARGLLWLQGGIWAWLAASTTVAIAVMLLDVLRGHRAWGSAAAVAGALAVAALTGFFAASKIRLATRLRDGSNRTRKTAVGIEVAMTLLGALITAGADPSGGMPADFVTLAALVGGGLSLAAAIGLLRRPAREYFAALRAAPTKASSDSNGDSNTVCTWLPLAFVKNRQSITARSAVATCYA